MCIYITPHTCLPARQSIHTLIPCAGLAPARLPQIGSTIFAQAAEVPTLAWSGSHVSMSFEECNGVIPPEIYDKACIFSVEQAISSCNQIGYPMMLKASWGGGGKGIRKVSRWAVIACECVCVYG